MATLASGKLSDVLEDFLKTVTDRSGNPVYREKISQLVSSEGKSLTVDFGDLLKYNSDVASKVLLDPDTSLASFKVAAFETLRSENALYADRIKRELVVRIRGIPDLVPLRKVDTSYLDRMLAVSGMVVRTSELRPMMTSAAWVCPSGHTTSEEQNDMMLKRPAQCEVCGETRNFELDKKHSRFIDFQILRVQELPEELPPGQLPQFFDVNAEGDIVNMARPGDRVVLSGIVRAVPDYTLGQVRMRLFRSQIDCNHIEVKGKEQEQIQVTKEDEAVIKSIAKGPDAFPKLVQSIAPVILGHDAEKEAILLLLAGGGATALPDGTKLRGDLNILFVGDPGTGKSEMLKFASQVATRGLYASGRGTTAAGLSAAVIREKNVLMLEAGVVVLADLGIACMTGDTEVYTGRSLESLGKTWDGTDGPTYQTRSGREAKKAFFPVNIYDGSLRSDISGAAYALMRKRYSGEVVSLTFGSGLSLKVTPEHLLRRTTEVKSLWVRADEVKVGDELKAPVRIFGPPACLDISENEAYAIGCTYGDGWLAQSGITISQSKVNVDVVRAISARMPGTFTVYDKGDRVRQLGKYSLVSRMMQLYTTERSFVKKAQLLLRGPSVDNVLMLRNESLWAFFAGVFDTDGDVNHSKGSIISLRIYPTKKEHELKVLLYALRRLGVYARIYGQRSSIPAIQMSGADITRFARGIGPFSVKLRNEPEEIVIRHKGRRSIERGRDRVVAVEKVPYDGYVYDFSVGKYHNYEASLVYVHNCIDEFEKMKAEDRTALHEMMEQQSYHPSNEVMFLDGTKSRIGDFVERAFKSDPGSVVQGVDCEILELRETFRVHSVGVDNKLVEARVDRVSRHRSPDHFYNLAFSNGRRVVVTPEHPVFVFRNAAMRTTDASNVRVGDFVPAPASIPPTGETCELQQVPAASNAKAVLQQKSLTPSMGRVLGYLVTEGNFYRGRTTEIDFANYNQWILDDMNRHAAPLFGFEPIPGVVGGKRVTLRYVSKVLYDYFRLNFPEMVRYSKEKRAPRQILAADAATIREFLAAAFLGDGSVEPDAVCYRTSSLGLAEDYQDLLLRMGVSSRLLKDTSNESYKVYVAGDSLPRFCELVIEREDPRYADILALVRRGGRNLRHHDVFPTDVAREVIRIRGELGLPYDGRYWRNLREGSGITRDSLEEELRVAEKRLGALQRAVRDGTTSLKEMRSECGWSQEHLARLAGATRRVVEYHERGGYQKAERARLEHRFRAGASEALHAVESDISEIRKLMEFRFLRVRAVERVENEGQWATDWVYDVTVEPTHNFVSNGLVLHNTVTIAKGGIYATLNARTAILAACNPILGRYNTFQNLTENIENLPVPLLTRFDLIFVIKDQPSPADDERLASHILSVHARRSYTSPPPIEFSLLKKYLAYAKRLSPTLTQEAMERIKDYYMELRRSSAEGQIPPTPRTLEALIRIATARARVLLRDEVKEEDAFEAISLMRKMVEDVLTDASTKKADFGIQFGKPAGETKNLRAAMELFRKLEGADKNPVERGVLKEALVKANFSEDDAEKMIRTMFREGIVYESKPGFIRRLRD